MDIDKPKIVLMLIKLDTGVRISIGLKLDFFCKNDIIYLAIPGAHGRGRNGRGRRKKDFTVQVTTRLGSLVRPDESTEYQFMVVVEPDT